MWCSRRTSTRTSDACPSIARSPSPATSFHARLFTSSTERAATSRTSIRCLKTRRRRGASSATAPFLAMGECSLPRPRRLRRWPPTGSSLPQTPSPSWTRSTLCSVRESAARAQPAL
eukprot:Amastigsp_a676288_29.p4 type:complete len:117 gc:universal Amastigsp_a676288_29:1592-1942(+)